MSRLSLHLLKGASVVAMMVALEACSGGNNNPPTTVATTPPAQTDQLAQLYGTGFAADFRMASTATPSVPMAGDIVPLSLTAAPNPFS